MINEKVPLGKHVKVEGGFAFQSAKFSENGIPIIRISNIIKGKIDTANCVKYPKESFENFKRYEVKEGDILIAMSGATTGKVGVFRKIEGKVLLNQRLGNFKIKNENNLLKEFLYRIVQSPEYQKKLKNIASGCAQPNISAKQLESIEVIIPPLPTQKKIVAILEKAEKLKGWRREADELTDELLKSTFLEMFYKNNPDYFNWEFVAIKDLTSQEKGSLRTGPFGSDLKHSEFVDSGIAVLGIDNVVNNRFQWGQRRYITKEKYDGLKRYTVHPNDILISIMATIGKSCVVPDDIPLSISTKHLAVITSDRTKCDPQFLSHSILFHPEIKQQLTKANIGAIMDGLNLKIIKSLKIPLPPLSLQHKFTEILKNVESVRQNQNQSQQKINNLFNALMQQAFRGELS